jgi:hypothetical protein
MSDIGDGRPCGSNRDRIFARLEEVLAFRTVPADGSEKCFHPNAGLKRQLVTALDLMHRAVDVSGSAKSVRRRRSSRRRNWNS